MIYNEIPLRSLKPFPSYHDQRSYSVQQTGSLCMVVHERVNSNKLGAATKELNDSTRLSMVHHLAQPTLIKT
ncbi:MAG: hypothetical protein WBB45_16455 [Cyclobacteriaceae bacterium]